MWKTNYLQQQLGHQLIHGFVCKRTTAMSNIQLKFLRENRPILLLRNCDRF